MGKEARERKQRQSARMAETTPINSKDFRGLWEIRLEVYCSEIWHAARYSQQVMAFSFVQSAQNELAMYGEEAMALYGTSTRAFLENEACRAIASVVGNEIYRMNQKLERNG